MMDRCDAGYRETDHATRANGLNALNRFDPHRDSRRSRKTVRCAIARARKNKRQGANTMRAIRIMSSAIFAAALASISVAAMAADYPAPKQGDWIAKNFKFHTGQVMPELRLH